MTVTSYAVPRTTAVRTCTLSGISLAKGKLITFLDLQRGIQVAMRDLEAEHRREQLWDKALLVAQLTKATCDAFLGLAAELSGFLPDKGVAAKAINAAYGVGSAVAGVTATAASGGQPDYAKAATSVAKSSATFVASEPIGFVIESHAVAADIVISAVQQDKPGVIRSSVDYGVALSKFTLSELKQTKAAIFVGIAGQAFSYNDQLNSALNDYYNSKYQNDSGYFRLKSTFRIQANQIARKIDELKDFLSTCKL